jgi:hypothetical protein
MRIDALRWTRRLLGYGALLAAGLLSLECGSASEGPTGGETHFLTVCDPESAPCGGDLLCLCQVCTLPCTGAADCSPFESAQCAAPRASSVCDVPTAGACEVTCSDNQGCAMLSQHHRCDNGVCRSFERVAAACEPSNSQANEVVLLGDTFFAATHAITAFLEDLARRGGALSTGERYRDYSRMLDNALALLGNGIEAQYATASAEAQVKVVVMTGGGADVLLGSCEQLTPDCPLLVAAAEAASALFQRMATDGVEHVVYTFYPDPPDPALKAAVDALRPLLASACAASPVPCHWLDLRSTFAGRESSYLDPAGTSPTDLGAEASANAIWSVMQLECIAQRSASE